MNILKSYGNDKTVVILTKPCGYRKKAPGAATRLITKIKYGRYPELVHTMNMRYKMYNREQEEIERLEKEGKIFVFRPGEQLIGRMESDYVKLLGGYYCGISDAENRLDELTEYLES